VTTSDAAPAKGRSIHVSAAVIVNERDELLLVRKAGTTAFMQPGGKPEPGESPSQTLSRELLEELGLSVEADTLRPLGSYTAAAANEPGFLVIAEVFETDIGAQVPVIGAEIEELRWVTRKDADGLEIAPLARENFLPA
jgi:8-oxo-dGTP diphosphatase